MSFTIQKKQLVILEVIILVIILIAAVIYIQVSYREVVAPQSVSVQEEPKVQEESVPMTPTDRPLSRQDIAAEVSSFAPPADDRQAVIDYLSAASESQMDNSDRRVNMVKELESVTNDPE